MSKNNLVLWDRHFKTNPAATKQVKRGGRTITAIDAYHQIHEATEEWGPMGRWGLKARRIWIENEMAIFEGDFFYPTEGGEERYFFICNSIDTMTRPRGKEPYRDPEWAKKLQTDTLTKALSYMGYNADVFFGLFDDARYVEERRKEEGREQVKEAEKLYAECIKALDEVKDIIEPEVYQKYKASLDNVKDVPARLKTAFGVIQGIRPEEKDPELAGDS